MGLEKDPLIKGGAGSIRCRRERNVVMGHEKDPLIKGYLTGRIE